MVSEKSVYWAAAVLMAVFVGNHFAKKHEPSSLADHAIAAIQHLSAEAGDFDSMTHAIFECGSSFSDPRLMARRKGRFAAIAARRDIACARIQAQRARMMAIEEMQHVRVRCPRQRIAVEIPNIPDGTI